MSVATFEDESQLATSAMVTSENAKTLLVRNAEENAEACDFLQEIAAAIKGVEEFFRPMKDAAYKAHKAITSRETEILSKLKEAKAHLSRQVGAWTAKQAEEHQAEQRRIQDKIDEEARQNALAANAKAMELADAGETALAVEVLQKAKSAATPPTISLPVPPKPKGITSTKVWKFRVVDAALVPREYLVVDEKAIGQVVRALKAQTHIPGVEVYSEDIVAVRS